MKKKIILAAALALSLQAKEVNLGVVLPLSGVTAAYGQSALEGIKLANEMQSTLANGDKINLVVLDTKGDKIESASAATRLVNQDKVLGLIGEMVTANTLQVMRIAEENKVPLIAPAATGDKLLENKLYSSRVCFMDSFQGSSLAKYAFEKIAGIPCFAEYAGEFRYENPVLGADCLVVIISQSGETADSLAALKQAREQGARTISIVNVAESSIAKMSEYSLLTKAGPEIAVATTKAFSCQAAMLNMLCLSIALRRGACSSVFAEIALNMSLLLPKKMERILNDTKKIKKLAKQIKDTDKCFFLGRNADYAAALEGALKLKEISYIDCVGCPASELKHGTISLIENGTVCFGIISNSRLLPKTVSNLQEVISRGADVTVFAPESLAQSLGRFNTVITYPDSIPFLTPSLEIVPLQLLAYYTAKEKGLPIDKPRNLAKSVTVE